MSAVPRVSSPKVLDEFQLSLVFVEGWGGTLYVYLYALNVI